MERLQQILDLFEDGNLEALHEMEDLTDITDQEDEAITYAIRSIDARDRGDYRQARSCEDDLRILCDEEEEIDYRPSDRLLFRDMGFKHHTGPSADFSSETWIVVDHEWDTKRLIVAICDNESGDPDCWQIILVTSDEDNGSGVSTYLDLGGSSPALAAAHAAKNFFNAFPT